MDAEIRAPRQAPRQAILARLHFPLAATPGRWNGSAEFPYDVPFWVLPRIGEVLNNIPDVAGWWVVADIEHDCSRGLHYPPTIRLLLRQR